MGNSSSSPAPPPSNLHDPPVSPHKSLRAKKKSLELPDLASLSLSSSPYHPGRGRTLAKSPCIPIPQANNPHAHYPSEPRTRPQNNFSSDLLVSEPPPHLPFPPHARPPTLFPPHTNGSANHHFGGAQPPRIYQYTPNHRKTGLDPLQRLSDHIPGPPPSSLNSGRIRPSPSRHNNGFVPEVVHSSVPIGLLKVATDENELVPVKISWRGGGRSVILARAGDNDWKGRQVMERVSPTSQVYSTTVNLPCGTHHFRFLVDDQWRVADDQPTAVDDQGTLANYVAVTLPVSPPKSASSTTSPSLPQQTHRHIPGQSFWSAASSIDGDIPEPPRLLRHSSSLSHHAAVWTSEIPQELIEAAKEEEAYLQASAGQYEANESKGGGTTYVSGFVPAPNIPPAPGLPRHLDKLILNTRMSPAPGSTTPSKTSTSNKAKSKDKDKSDRDGRRHRDSSEKYKRVPPPPPPPPPSEDGSVDPNIPDNDGSTAPATAGPDDATQSTTAARSKPIGIDPSHTPGLTDDASVLSVPSHVVLHHLCTSAIRNGVLAVANTTRYREKFLTTVYYKPT